MENRQNLPVAVIGAGPIGLAAAAHLASRGESFVVLEAGGAVGAAVRAWSHVQVFSPWRYNVDPVARKLLAAAGWVEPDPDHLPTGRELVEDYLAPLAALPALAPHIRLATRVVAISRAGVDKLVTAGREAAPFELCVRTGDVDETILARAVIDASGTWGSPNPLGASGLPALGEAAARERIAYGIPDVLGADRARYAGRRLLVVGSGHSAFNVLLDLVALAERTATSITWVIRRREIGPLYGGGAADALPARGALGTRLQQAVQAGRVRLVTGFRIMRVTAEPEGVGVVATDGRALGPFDEIVGATGFRPDLGMLGELRLRLDATVESPAALATLIDPNVHSCGTVPPHGAEELGHPEPDFYVVGMKSYGRAPTFLMLTGYEQVRSVVAALTGDLEAARRVELTLPETGVCSASPAETDSACARPGGDGAPAARPRPPSWPRWAGRHLEPRRPPRPAAGRRRGRHHLQLRHQPLRRQGRRAGRGVPGAEAGWAPGRLRRRGARRGAAGHPPQRRAVDRLRGRRPGRVRLRGQAPQGWIRGRVAGADADLPSGGCPRRAGAGRAAGRGRGAGIDGKFMSAFIRARKPRR